MSAEWLPMFKWQDIYMTHRHGQVSSMAGKIQRKYVKKALPEGSHPNAMAQFIFWNLSDDHPHFLEHAVELANVLRNIIFVDQVGIKHRIPVCWVFDVLICAPVCEGCISVLKETRNPAPPRGTYHWKHRQGVLVLSLKRFCVTSLPTDWPWLLPSNCGHSPRICVIRSAMLLLLRRSGNAIHRISRRSSQRPCF